MFIGGFLGFFLDNTIPGTKRERGLLCLDKNGTEDTNELSQSWYLVLSDHRLLFLVLSDRRLLFLVLSDLSLWFLVLVSGPLRPQSVGQCGFWVWNSFPVDCE
uniref:Uncharacterized protein n=1 Tax=Knipowitschia caucasica TaxID=637954 RepID=A0AAV2KAB6_KNICA